ncbi:MAG: LegC family aminotransferase [Flavobacteriales bacterium]|nr:LegC family aminotransferase [Flavobacteriales bacterium]
MKNLSHGEVIQFIRDWYEKPEGFIPLHAPHFGGNEKKYLIETIDSTFVSSVGPFVDKFESMMREYTGAKYAIAVVNGTAALHMGLMLAGTERGDLVITQALSFIATCNAISYIEAEPYFVDVDPKTLGLSADALEAFLKDVSIQSGKAIHRPSGKRVAACVPMHTFGFPSEIDRIVELCDKFHIPVVEDAAESLGSTYRGKHTGTFGKLGTYSFNGNKTVTCGGGGIIVTDDETLGKKGKHLTTQAKVPHRWEFVHDHVGYNYRCPNLNAALACAQLEQLEGFIQNKRETAAAYEKYFADSQIQFVAEPSHTRSNYWLNAVMFQSNSDRDSFLQATNDAQVMTRPAWELMHRLSMFKHCGHDGLKNSIDIASRLVNIPSSVKLF